MPDTGTSLAHFGIADTPSNLAMATTHGNTGSFQVDARNEYRILVANWQRAIPLEWLTNGSDSIFKEHSLLLQFLWWVEREGKNEGGREGREEGKREEGKEGVRINEGPRREGGEEGKRGGSSRRV